MHGPLPAPSAIGPAGRAHASADAGSICCPTDVKATRRWHYFGRGAGTPTFCCKCEKDRCSRCRSNKKGTPRRAGRLGKQERCPTPPTVCTCTRVCMYYFSPLYLLGLLVGWATINYTGRRPHRNVPVQTNSLRVDPAGARTTFCFRFWAMNRLSSVRAGRTARPTTYPGPGFVAN